jgi:hypothetical protein
VGWFPRKKSSESPVEHAVILHYSLSDDEHGTVEEREAVFALEDRLEELIGRNGLGELDGNEFGGGEAVIYCYGPDATRLFAGIETEARAFSARPAYAYLRFGNVDDEQAVEERIHF